MRPNASGLTRHKLSAYSAYLAHERDRLERDLTEAPSQLRQKVELLAESHESKPDTATVAT